MNYTESLIEYYKKSQKNLKVQAKNIQLATPEEWHKLGDIVARYKLFERAISDATNGVVHNFNTCGFHGRNLIFINESNMPSCYELLPTGDIFYVGNSCKFFIDVMINYCPFSKAISPNSSLEEMQWMNTPEDDYDELYSITMKIKGNVYGY